MVKFDGILITFNKFNVNFTIDLKLCEIPIVINQLIK